MRRHGLLIDGTLSTPGDSIDAHVCEIAQQAQKGIVRHDRHMPTSPPTLPALVPLADVLPRIPCGRKQFISGIENGSIPLSVVMIGKGRRRYVRRADLDRWLTGQPSPQEAAA